VYNVDKCILYIVFGKVYSSNLDARHAYDYIGMHLLNQKRGSTPFRRSLSYKHTLGSVFIKQNTLSFSDFRFPYHNDRSEAQAFKAAHYPSSSSPAAYPPLARENPSFPKGFRYPSRMDQDGSWTREAHTCCGCGCGRG
jgi:hypothetical protein